MKKLLYIFFTVLSVTSLAQTGSLKQSGYFARVNDTTAYQAAAATAHAQGYADTYWNNQATTPHWDRWDGSAYEHIFENGSGSGTGVTDGDKGDITVSGTGSTWMVDNTAITDAKISDRAALSVFGRSSNSSGVGADITAGTDNHVLRRSGTSIAFGTIGNSSISDLAFSKLSSVPTTLAGYGITDQIWLRGGNAFGAASALGLTDNFNLTLQTGNASLLFNTNGNNRLTIDNTGAASFSSSATANAFIVNGTAGAAGVDQIALRTSGVTRFSVRDNGEFTFSPSSGAVTSGVGLVWRTNATQNVLYDFAPLTGTTNSLTGNKTSIGSWTHTTGSGNVVAYNAVGTFAPNAGAYGNAGLLINSTVNSTGSYSGLVAGVIVSRTLTSTTGANMVGFLSTETSSKNGFGLSATDLNSILDTGGSFGAAIASTSSDITLGLGHHTVLVDASGANRTITLPAASGATRRVYVIKKTDSSTNTVTIDGNSTETIDGATTQVLSVQNNSYTIQCNGTAWYITNVVDNSANVRQSWTPTVTGFTSPPTVSGQYTLIGKTCTASVLTSVNGTSNATTFTITLPFAASSSAIQYLPIRVTNNNAVQTTSGMLATRTNSNIADLYINWGPSAGGAWTSGGANKGVNFTFTYIIE